MMPWRVGRALSGRTSIDGRPKTAASATAFCSFPGPLVSMIAGGGDQSSHDFKNARTSFAILKSSSTNVEEGSDFEKLKVLELFLTFIFAFDYSFAPEATAATFFELLLLLLLLLL